MKTLSKLEWTPAWTSLVGCIHGCLKYLDIAPSLDWLFGATGHGLIINMSKDGSCPSGPTAWKTSRFFDLGRNLGYKIDGVFGDKRQPGFKDKQIQAWELTKAALDQNFPVIGWEIAIPEWYVIFGYDDAGYLYNGPGEDQGPSPKPWRKLGKTGIGLIEVYSIKPTKAVDDKKTIKEAIEFAITFNQGAKEWVIPDYLTGLDAYDAWIDAVRSGKAMLMGHAYNAAVWEECRRRALGFLNTAKNRLEGSVIDPLDMAISDYTEIARQLKSVTELYPFIENSREEPIGKNPKSAKAAESLQAARDAEQAGLQHLAEVLARLN